MSRRFLPRIPSALLIFAWLLTTPACTPKEKCDNGIDDDSNGVMDCFDPVCAYAPKCSDFCYDNVSYWTRYMYCQQGDRCEQHITCQDELCFNGIDDNNDGFTDCADPLCESEPGCLEDCSNGLDDNANGLTDCEDDACASEQYCQTPCSMATIYADSPESCPPGEACLLNSGSGALEASCESDEFAGTGSLMGACDPDNDVYCPQGAFCVQDFGCAAICDNNESTAEHNCPAGAICIYNINGAEGLIWLCAVADCHPLNQDCQDPQKCILNIAEDSTVCAPDTGTVAIGGSCQYEDQCIKGSICVDSLCSKICYGPSPQCPTGQSCYLITDGTNTTTIWGACFTP